jgi:hypothetical protein
MDFVDPTLSHWNRELLSTGGIICRVLFENEIGNSKLSSDQYIHIINSFTCHQSTPAAIVSQLISRGFFASSEREIYVLSTKGIQPISQVRLYDHNVAQFMAIPMIERKIVENARPFFTLMQDAGLLNATSIADVMSSAHLITEDSKLTHLLSWIILQKGRITEQERKGIISRIKYSRFASQRLFPPASVLPESVLPIQLSRNHEENDLKWIG